jgi:proteasome accessory factor C
MRLSRAELAALDLGLGMLLLERPLEERATIMATRVKLRSASVGAPSSGAPSVHTVAADDAQSTVAVEAAPERLLEHFGALWKARDEHRAVRIEYRREGASDAESRVVHPWAVVRAYQHVYVIGWCTSVTAVRVFRLDRVASVSLDGATFEVPTDFDVQSVMRDGRMFVGERPHDTLVVRYSPLVARWIAEREAVPLDPDGSVTVEWPLADDEWAVRHVLQYGAEATVVSPDRVRNAVVARLELLMALDKPS